MLFANSLLVRFLSAHPRNSFFDSTTHESKVSNESSENYWKFLLNVSKLRMKLMQKKCESDTQNTSKHYFDLRKWLKMFEHFMVFSVFLAEFSTLHLKLKLMLLRPLTFSNFTQKQWKQFDKTFSKKKNTNTGFVWNFTWWK